MSPTQRTLKYYRDKGMLIWIVERWLPIPTIPGGGKRVDLFNIIDLIALSDKIIGIQSCGSDFKAHIHKIMSSEYTEHWLKCADLQLIGWRKVKKKRGGKAMRWKPRIADFYFNGGVKWEERV